MQTVLVVALSLLAVLSLAAFDWAFGPMHDYARLLVINIAILAGGFGAFILGASLPHRADSQARG